MKIVVRNACNVNVSGSFPHMLEYTVMKYVFCSLHLSPGTSKVKNENNITRYKRGNHCRKQHIIIDMFHVFTEASLLWQFFPRTVIFKSRSSPPPLWRWDLEKFWDPMYICISLPVPHLEICEAPTTYPPRGRVRLITADLRGARRTSPQSKRYSSSSTLYTSLYMDLEKFRAPL